MDGVRTAVLLQNNALDSLPEGLFSGLTALTYLTMGGNPTDPLPLTVTVEKVGTDQVRAKVLAGAPFAVDIPVTLVNGTLAGSATALSVAAGAVDGTAVTVTRTAGTTAAVTVDVDLTTPPTLPANHRGYEFVKATTNLPATILAADTPTCTLNTGDIWCGVVTPASHLVDGVAFAHGFVDDTPDTGALSDKEFSVVTDGVTNSYTIVAVAIGVGNATGSLSFSLTSGLTAADAAKLVLHVDGSSDQFAFSVSRNPYVWPRTDLDWSSGDPVTLRLRDTAAATPPDAPTGFTATVGDAQVALAWKAARLYSGVTGHEFRYKTDGDYPEDWTAIAYSGPDEKRALDLISDWPWIALKELAGLMGVSTQRVSHGVIPLEGFGLAARPRGAGGRLALTDRGLALLARRDRTSVAVARKRWSVALEDAEGPFEWRNVTGRRGRQLLRNTEHTAAVHGFLAALAAQAPLLGWEVVQLDPPRRASRHFRHDDRMRAVNPDAFGVLRKGDTRWPFFLEWERRAVRPSTMSERLAPYLRYYSSHRPTDDHGTRPSVLVVFDDEIARTHFLRVAREETHESRVNVPLLVSHREAVDALGPMGHAWRTPADRETPQALPPQ